MSQLNLLFAFTAGMLATVNPCGWAMLPSFVAYYLGSRQAGYDEQPFLTRMWDGLLLGLLVTAGFLVVFGGAGIAISSGLRVIVQWVPFVALLVGVVLTLLGVWLLAGKSLPFSLPTLNVDLQSRNPKTAFLFGIAYAFASLSCTLPVFLVVVGTSLTAASVTGNTLMFFSYAGGMAVVLMRWRSKPDRIATLLLGLYDAAGEIDYVGSAAVAASRHAAIAEQVLPLLDETSDRRFSEPNRWGGSGLEEQPLRHELVAEVRYDKVQGQRFRHGTKLLRFRPDKDPHTCTWAELRPPRDFSGLTIADLLGP